METERSTHALISPSSAAKWMVCSAAPRMERDHGGDDEMSFYAAEGVAAHFLASETLSRVNNKILSPGVSFFSPAEFLGRKIYVWGGVASWVDSGFDASQIEFEVDTDMVEFVEEYTSSFLALPFGSVLFVESRVDISMLSGEENAKGTADAVVITPDGELQVHDLKYGMRLVPVTSPQLLMYAAGVFFELASLTEFKKVTLRIHQPRRKASPSVSFSTDEFLQQIEELKGKSEKAFQLLTAPAEEVKDNLAPGAHCIDYYCKARAHCPALAAWALDDVEEDTAAIDVKRLASLAGKLDTVRGWCEAIETRLNSLVLSGVEVPGFKAVEGRKGNRKWVDPEEAGAILLERGVPDPEVFERSVKTPAKIEKLVKVKILRKEDWDFLQSRIMQEPAKPTVVPEIDPRPALNLCDIDIFNQ